jgi:hypothetical protein
LPTCQTVTQIDQGEATSTVIKALGLPQEDDVTTRKLKVRQPAAWMGALSSVIRNYLIDR